MRSYEILEVINELDAVLKKFDLTDEEKSIADFSQIENFKSNLLMVIEHKKKLVQLKNAELNERMSPVKLTAEQYREFYQNVNFDEEVRNHLAARFNMFNSFEFPVLELFPGKGDFTTVAVAAEPLYIADYYMENLEKVGSLFNEFYNTRRLLKEEITDYQLNFIPANQLGLAFCYNYFIVKDINFITKWAEEIFTKLRPAGHFLFNFIPDDTPSGLMLSEIYKLSSINHVQLEANLRQIGYEIINKSLEIGYSSTFTIKKPGDYNQFKISSSLARVIDISEPFV